MAGSNEAMFGQVWDADYTANDMTKNGDGTYSITYTNVYLTEEVQYKVVKDHDWGEAYPDDNRVINIAKAGTYTVTIHFNPTTHEVYETMPGYAVTLAEGTEDAANWSITPAKAAEGETVTIQYNGTRRIKSITAVQTAAAEEQQEEAATATPLTMECLTDGTIVVNMGSGTLSTGMQYAVNGGAKTKITETTEISGLKTGDKVQFYGVGTSTTAYGGYPTVKIAGGTAQVKVYGNIMSLLDETGFATKTELPNSQYVFYGLFYGNDKLTDASGLLLPATTLAQSCYHNMFQGCTALTAAPALPATTLAIRCYQYMFNGCTALTAAPALPATTLAPSCYNNMFSFCYKLASVTCKATNISALDCLKDWLKNAGTDESVTSPTLYVDPTMTSNTGWNNGDFTVTAY